MTVPAFQWSLRCLFASSSWGSSRHTQDFVWVGKLGPTAKVCYFSLEENNFKWRPEYCPQFFYLAGIGVKRKSSAKSSFQLEAFLDNLLTGMFKSKWYLERSRSLGSHIVITRFSIKCKELVSTGTSLIYYLDLVAVMQLRVEKKGFCGRWSAEQMSIVSPIFKYS